MTSNRFHPGNHQSLTIPAAKGLINSAVAPQRLSLIYARDVENMIPTQGKKLSKRRGLRRNVMTGMITDHSIKHLDRFTTSAGTQEIIAFTDTGKIFKSTNFTSWTEIFTGLDVLGTFGTCHFNEKLIIFNGMDTPMTYNGTSVAPILEWVADQSTPFTKSSATTFTFTAIPGRSNTDYPAGRSVRVTMNTGTFTGTVSSSSYNSGTGVTTVILTSGVMTGATISGVSFQRALPAFSFMYPWNDRLWALSPGELKPKDFRGGEDRLKVFYTDTTNNEQVWANELTMEVAYIDMQNKHLVNDEFLCIASYQDALIFFGRENSQVWTGSDPTVSGNFSWQKTIPVGILQPFLIQEVGQDLLFYTRNGVKSFSRIYKTEDLELVDEVGSNMKDLASRKIADLLAKDYRYKSARSFRYGRGNFVGFKLYDEVHLFFSDKESKGWVRFTGLFSSQDAFCSFPNDNLYCAGGNLLFVYGDDENRYSDDGEPIRINWLTGWLQPKQGARWGNRYVEIEIDPGDETTAQLWRYKNNDDSSYVVTEMVLPRKASFWDDADWDVDFWDAGSGAKYSRAEDKFLCYNLAYKFTSNSTVGPIDIVAITIFGKTER